jgi:hypothetical protein
MTEDPTKKQDDPIQSGGQSGQQQQGQVSGQQQRNTDDSAQKRPSQGEADTEQDGENQDQGGQRRAS